MIGKRRSGKLIMVINECSIVQRSSIDFGLFATRFERLT
jgi:hypothetical protein